MLGALPLALENGTGSELRRPLGISIVGGLLLSQFLTLYTTPVIYLYLDRFGRWLAERRRKGRPPEGDEQPDLPLGPMSERDAASQVPELATAGSANGRDVHER